MLTLDKIYQASYALKTVIRRTDLISAPNINPESHIFLKPENLQVTGSFKVRGACFKIAQLTEEEKSHGVVACSAGNHAQGVALAATAHGIKSLICLPDNAPISKVEATKSYGADVCLVEGVYDDELKVMIDQHVSSPSIVMWVPFNENWGAFEATDITAWVKKYDPNRWVNGMSGYNYAPGYRKAYGDPGNGDFVDMHHYGKIEPKAIPRPDDKRAASLGEFGGKGLFVRGHMWPVRNDAYEMMLNREVLTDTYVLMLTELEQMINYFGLSTAIYTQTTDVEHEINGLVTYDRKVEKMDLEKVKYINQEVIKCTRAK